MKRLIQLSVVILYIVSLQNRCFSQSFNYGDFSDISGLILNGSAANYGSVLRLTSSTNSQGGSIWHINKIKLTSEYTTKFDFRITEAGGVFPGGADGFAFVIQGDSNNVVGASGGGIGYSGIRKSIAIEFDTWDNNYFPDPNDNHISIHTRYFEGNSANHNYAIGTNTNISNLSNGEIYTVKIICRINDLSIDSIFVFFEDFSEPTLSSLFEIDSLYLEDNFAWLGFTAATGDAYENHDIISWYNYNEIPPQLIEPTNNARMVERKTLFKWQKFYGTNEYNMQLSETESFENILVDTYVNDTTLILNNLDRNKIYFWRVRAITEIDTTNFSEIWSFVTGIQTPALISPADAASGVSVQPELLWEDVGSNIVYRLQLSRDADFTDISLEQEGIAENSFEPPALDYGATYYWRVKACDGENCSFWSEARSFTTETAAVPALTLSRREFDFGSLAIGGQGSLNLTIRNTGATAITLDSYEFIGEGFSTNAAFPIELSPGESAEIALTFAPDISGEYEARLLLFTDELSVSPIYLYGIGYELSDEPELGFSQQSPFSGSAGVDPQSAGGKRFFEYRVVYSDPDGDPPMDGFPKVGIDLDGDRAFDEPGEDLRSMSEVDADDQNYADGKEYVYIAELEAGAGYGYRFFAYDEGGNVAGGAAASYMSGPSFTASGLPDLAIFPENIKASDWTPEQYTEITISATFKNLASGFAEGVVVRFYDDYTLLHEETIAYFNGNGEAAVDFNTSFDTQGLHRIRVFIDEDFAIAETDDYNNGTTYPVMVGEYSIIGSIEATSALSAGRVRPGQRLRISGRADYVNTLDPDTDVAGATVELRLEETGAIYSTHTKSTGNYSYCFIAPSTPGTYTICGRVTDYTLSADIPCQTFEVWEPEPVFCADLSVRTFWGPDITWDSHCNAVGETINGTAYVTNRGNLEAEDVLVHIYADDILIKTETFENIGVYERVPVSFSVSYATPGRHKVKAMVDPYDAIPECREWNNRGELWQNILEAGCDVNPYDIAFSSKYPWEDDRINMTFKIRNNNPQTSCETTALIYDVYGETETLIATLDLAEISGCSYRNLYLNNYVPIGLGSHTITIIAGDCQCDIRSSNNEYSEVIYVKQKKPDLAIRDILSTYIYWTSECKAVDDEINVRANVRNYGNLSSPESIARISIDGGEPTEYIVPALNPGETYDINFAVQYDTPGTHGLSVTLDPDDEIDELSEWNNAGSVSRWIYPLEPDLGFAHCGPFVWDIWFSDASPCPGSSTEIYVRATNFNCAESSRASESTQIHLYDVFGEEERLIGTVDLGSLGASESETVVMSDVSYPLSETGWHSIKAVIDQNDNVNEYDESNNICQRGIFVDKPDLAVESVTGDFEPGEDAEITTNIKNTGNCAANNIEVVFTIDGEQQGTIKHISELQPGQSIDVVSDLTTLPAAQEGYCPQLCVKVDEPDNIDELYENNNQLCKLAAYDLTASTTPYHGWNKKVRVFKGKPAFLKARIGNSGIYDAADVPVSYFVDGEYIGADYVDVPGEGHAGAQLSHIFNTPGNYTVYVYADSLYEVGSYYPECNEDNNVDVIYVEVWDYLPDLAIYSSDLKFVPENPDINEPTELSAFFRNEGLGPSSPFKISFLANSIPLAAPIEVPGMDPGEEFYYICPNFYSYPYGGFTHVIRTLLDVENVVRETDELNNEGSRAIIVGDAPNLTFPPNPIVMSNSELEAGELIDIEVTILNDGKAAATTGLLYVDYVRDFDTTRIAEFDIPTIEGSATTSFEFEWEAAANYGEILARIDDVEPYEYTTFDNEASLIFDSRFPNPLALAISVEDGSIWRGTLTRLSATTSGGSGDYLYSWSASGSAYSSLEQNPQISPDYSQRYYLTVDDGYYQRSGSVDVDVKYVELVYPANGAQNVEIYPNMKWRDFGEPVEYNIQISSSSTFGDILVDAIAIIDTNYFCSALSYNTKYYWRVRAYDASNTCGWSDVYSFEIKAADTLTINLNTGWNMISSYVEPWFTDMPSVFGALSPSRLYLALNNTNQIYFHADGSGNLTNWDYKQGYRVYNFQSCSFDMLGRKVLPDNEPIGLNLGWNMISYLRDEPTSPAEAFATLGSSQLYLVLNNTNQIYFHSDGSGNLTELSPTQGYRLYMFVSAQYIYPPNRLVKASEAGDRYREPRHFVHNIGITGNYATLILNTGDVEEGCEVGLFDAQNRLVGSAVVQNGKALIPIFGDDDMTKEIEASSEGEALVAKLYNPYDKTIKDLQLVNLYNDNEKESLSHMIYKRDGVFTGKAEIVERPSLDLLCAPNPMQSGATIIYTLDRERTVTLEIVNSLGATVATLAAGEKTPAGTRSVAFDATNLPSGVYYCVLKADGVSKMIKIAVVK